MSYIGNSPGVASQRVETAFTATASQTVFTPSSGYTLGYCDVYYNGVKLVNGDDYTAADGVSITLATAAAAGDSVVVVASFPRGLSDGYLKAEADAKYVALTGDQTVAGVKTFSGSATIVNGNLGVGTSSVLGNSTFNAALGIAVRNQSTSMGYFQTYNANAGSNLKTWRFGGDSSGNLVFETVNDAYSSATGRAVLDASGNLLVGATSAGGVLTLKNPIVSSENILLSIQAAAAGTTTIGKITYNQSDDSLRLYNTSSYSGSALILGTNNAERVRVDASGNVGVGVAPAVSKFDVFTSSSTNTVLTLFRGTQGNDNSMPVAFGSPYLKVGQTEWRAGAIQTIGFGYSPGANKTSPAEIGIVTTSTAGQTYGDIVFATRTVTTDTAPSERARIDSVGRFTVTNQPVFFGRGAANRDANYAVQGALFKFETITTNTGSRYDSSTGLFTAPVAGNYLVCWNILVDDNNSTIGQMASVRINGSDRYWAYSINALAYMPTTLVNIVSLSANDTISFYCYAKIHGGTDTSASICLLN